MEKVKVSVIIPAYNAEKFIAETLDSILNQSLSSYEVIIMNDGSIDKTQDIIDLYEQENSDKIKCFYQTNQGQSAARNNALQFVNGECIAFIDADDTIAEWYLEELYNAIQNNSADIAVCAYQKYESETGKITLKRYTEEWNVEFENGYSHVFQYSPCARMMKTKFVKKYGFLFSVGEQLEDGPYCMMVDLLSAKTVVLNKIGYFYRVYEESTMGNVRDGKKEPKVPYKGIETAIKTVKDNTEDAIILQMLEFCATKILAGLATNMYSNCSQKVRKDICNYCYYILNKYFPNVSANPYVGMRKLNKLPFSHRAAVKLFVISYKLKIIYPFSSVVAFAIRVQGRVSGKEV